MPLSLKETLANEDFKGLPDVEKRKVLTTRFPDFSLLPPLEQNKVLNYREPTLGERALTTLSEGATGYASGVLRNVLGIPGQVTGMGKAASSMARSIGGRNLAPEVKTRLEQLTTERTPEEKMGGNIFRTAAFMAPEAAGLRLPETAPVLARMGTEALKTGAIGGMQSDFKPGETFRSAALGAAFPAAGWAMTKGLKLASEYLGLRTGVGGDSIRYAAQQASDKFRKAMTGGKDEIEIVEDTKDALNRVKDMRRAEYQRDLANLPQKNLPQVVPALRRKFLDLARSYRINTVPTRAGGMTLDFSHSYIRNSPSDIAKVQSVFNDLDRWSDHSALGLDSLKRGVDDLYGETSQARSLIQSMKSEVRDALNKGVPGYEKMTQKYAKASELIDRFTTEFSLKSGTGTTVRKLMPYLFTQNNEYRKMLIQAVDMLAGTELEPTLRGYQFREMLPRGLVGRGILGEESMRWLHRPEVAIGFLGDAVASSPRAVGELMSLISVMRRNPTVQALFAAGKQATRGAGLATLPQLGGQQ